MPRFLLLVLFGVSTVLLPSANTAGHAIVNQIHAHRQGIAVWWTGNDGWLIKSGDLLIGLDLTLDNDEKVQPPPVTASDIAEDLDVVFVTHHHSDHCNPETLRTLMHAGNAFLCCQAPALKS